ncbi:hypothetical protein IHE45_12G081700 [Dioscorea alata]|uniref:Uncharacterized protein n=1 Tax=Dioscorea alata TaxID=55571 RepID=A0ACB7V3L8_DIOAL|nr:hypothetical protein IHE45_12G081700 [Dioscorea alata]
MANKTMVLKLLIDTKENRVLFAEAGKEVVDFIFGLLALPLGSIVKVLGQDQMVGSIGSIYSGLKNLSSSYMQPDQKKDILLNPNGQSHCQNNVLLLPAPAPAKVDTYYSCGNVKRNDYDYDYGSISLCPRYVSEVCGIACPSCKRKMDKVMQLLDHESGQELKRNQVGGYVKDVVTYTIMDDLSVMPMSSISSITLLNKFSIKNVNVLKEQTVKLGMEEAMELLKASFDSKTVLTDVFLASRV